MIPSRNFAAAIVIAAASASAGWVAHTDRTVHGAELSAAPIAFQLQGSGPDAQLALYDANSRTISVYQGLNSGSDTKRCSYQLILSRSGGAIHRSVCEPGSLP